MVHGFVAANITLDIEKTKSQKLIIKMVNI